MTKMHTVTIPISPDEHVKLSELAHAREQSEEDIAREAMRTYLSLQDRHIEEITRSLDEAERPDARFIPHEDVVAWVDSLESEQPLPRPQPSVRAQR